MYKLYNFGVFTVFLRGNPLYNFGAEVVQRMSAYSPEAAAQLRVQQMLAEDQKRDAADKKAAEAKLKAAEAKRTVAEVISGQREQFMEGVRAKVNEDAKQIGAAVVEVRRAVTVNGMPAA